MPNHALELATREWRALSRTYFAGAELALSTSLRAEFAFAGHHGFPVLRLQYAV